MPVHLATTRDLHRLGQITVTSLIDDPTFHYKWSKRHEFPEDNFFFWQLMLKEWLYDPKQTFLVVVLDAADLSNDEKAKEVLDTIISYAVWGSIGESKGGQATQAGEEYMAEFVRQVEAWSISLKYERRDADKHRLAAFSKASKFDLDHCFADIKDWWLLELLITERPFHRRGAATTLVRWGIAEAGRERISCGVESSSTGPRLYRACGLVTLKTTALWVQG